MKKIKLTFPYPEWPIDLQLPKREKKWGDCLFYINPENDLATEYDFHFVFNYPLCESETTFVSRNNTILITGEPESVEIYGEEYTNQFGCIITSQRNLKHPRKFYLPQGLPWFIGKSFDELIHMEDVLKTKNLSIISSNKVFTRGHRLRLDFVTKLKSKFKDRVDLYGRGIAPFSNKWDVLAPYKYSVVIENSSHLDYFTEKITDTFLTYTFPIYFGAPNIYQYFDQGSVEVIDIMDLKESMRKIEEILDSENHYSNKLDLLRTQRLKVLNEYNLFGLIDGFIKINSELNENKKEEVVIRKILPRKTRNNRLVNGMLFFKRLFK